jgi:hypothetical protein
MAGTQQRPPRRRSSRSRVALALAAFVILTAQVVVAEDTIPAIEASHHIGEVAKVCGRVASAAYFSAVKGSPTFLNLERPYPDQPFTVVIWGSARSRFEKPPERLFDGRSICVSGRIETYRGKPQIVVEDPAQVEVREQPTGGESLTDFERIFVKSLLASLGHDANYGTGEWDQESVEAMIAFQEETGVEATGDPDAATLRALAERIGNIPEDERTMIIRLLLFELVRRKE